jgi:signal transduction histidine kinase
MLHPVKLEHVGLVAAVRGLCEEVTRGHGLLVTFTHAGVPDALPATAALCLYRIAQEALRNVVRHSGSDHATVELTGATAAVRLVVRDGGAGFDPSSALRTGGLGLVGMRERVHLAGGVLTIDARPAGGTRVDALVPARRPARQGGAPDRAAGESPPSNADHPPGRIPDDPPARPDDRRPPTLLEAVGPAACRQP